MQEYTTKGTIICTPINVKNVEAGTVCLIKADSEYHRVTIMHINHNADWVVNGDYNGVVEQERPLYNLSALTTSDCIPIGFKDWKAIIKAGLIDVSGQTFLIKPKQFKPGHNPQTCSNCHCTFLAARNQPLCKNCCNDLAIAYLHGDSKERSAEKKYTRTFVEDFAHACYDRGWQNIPGNNFKEFIKEKLDGNNTTEEKT